MEHLFLALLIGVMIIALTSGFPVAFALPGAAIISISLAALSGYLIEGDVNAYFVQDGPVQWLTAGVTNFRSLYWDVERDTLIAIPLFVFMGIMLQRSKIAEDLLVTMAQLFGPIPGGLGISVVFVGALLAATTGIVGATVIAMGLISLPAMLRHNYSKPLACGTICASGTLGQIIPPSIVLIILADQLSSAADQASSLRKAEYKEITGEFSMPSHLDITSASAGDMFMGALIPGLILVGIYMLYILVVALLNPKKAPPVPFEGEFDRQFALKVFLALVPPLTLIFIVLGSIIAGIATVNQAGAIGAVGAMIMGSYRLAAGRKSAYYPAILAVVSIALMGITLSLVDINVKSIDGSGDWVAIFFAGLGTVGLMTAAAWAAIRAYRTNDTLAGVMNETAKTTSMVFIILIGAAMLTAAFRGFGGEELVKHFLTGLPGGFWTQFIVVMLVIFLLGFFLDFIEIAVVVVPIVAPILLMNPEANITAVWLGVMVGLNIQTSFLTPPFGFSLFYLRGVAPPEVKTLQIYKGAAAFIVLQLVGLTIAGAFPPLVNYLPYRTALTSETAPPPINPRLQACLEDYVFDLYDQDKAKLEKAIEDARALDLAVLPKSQRQQLEESLKEAAATFGNVAAVRGAESDRLAYAVEYKPLHTEVRRQQLEIRRLSAEIDDLKQNRTRLSREQSDRSAEIADIEADIKKHDADIERLRAQFPAEWEDSHKRYTELAKAEKTARGNYRRAVDSAYQKVDEIRGLIRQADGLAALNDELRGLSVVIQNEEPEAAMDIIKAMESRMGEFDGVSKVKSRLSKARRELKPKKLDREKAAKFLAQGIKLYETEVKWRKAAADKLLAGLDDYEASIRGSLGIRSQKRLNDEQADAVAACQSHHRDISLHF